MTRKNHPEVSMLVQSDPASIHAAFVEPELLSRFWLKRSSGPLQCGVPVTWDFRVPGASETTIAEELIPPGLISFRWSDGTRVRIEIDEATRGASIVRIAAGPCASASEAVALAEGFCIVLCDLKILLESGKSPGLVKDKARLISGP